MSKQGDLFLDYSYSRCAIPVLITMLDGSEKPAEASSIDEAGRWLAENVGQVAACTWSMYVRHILNGKISEYREMTASYLDLEKKCKGYCQLCGRYQNRKELDGVDMCGVCFKIHKPKEPPKERRLPNTARTVVVIPANGDDPYNFNSIKSVASYFKMSRSIITKYCNGEVSSLHTGLQFYWADSMDEESLSKRVKTRIIKSLNDDRQWFKTRDCARDLGCAESSVRNVLIGRMPRVRGVRLEWVYI